MGAKCCAPSSCKVRKRYGRKQKNWNKFFINFFFVYQNLIISRLLDEYETHEVYVPSRSVSQDPEAVLAGRRRDSTVRVSVRSEGAAAGQMKTSNSTAGVSLTLPRVKNHTIRATDTVPIVRVPARRPPSRVETSHVV